MKKRKPLILIVFIIIVIGILAYFILFTDKFKTSKKDKFFENLSKIDINKYINLDEYKDYYNNLKSSKYTAKQTIDLEADKYINELNLKKVVDNEKNKKTVAITVKEDNQALLKLSYLKNNDLHGVKIDDVISQYIVVENKDVQKFVNKFEIKKNTNIPEKIKNIDLSNLPNNEEFKITYDEYVKILKDSIGKKNYQKIGTQKIEIENKQFTVSGYKLVLENQEFKNIVKQLLEKAENDDKLYNILSNITPNLEELTYVKYQDKIKDIIDSINNEDGKLDISLYKNKEDLLKLSIDITVADKTNSYAIEFAKDKIILSIDKLNTKENIEQNIKITKDSYESGIANWNISYIKTINKSEIWNVDINLLRKGQLNSKSIKYIADIDLQNEDINLKINSNNIITFQDQIEEIETFTEENCALINGVNKEQLAVLTNGIKEILSEYINIEKSAVGFAEKVIFNIYKIEKDI